jgi:hypothetical protein
MPELKVLCVLHAMCAFKYLNTSCMDNLENFQTKLSIHGVDTRNETLLYTLVTSLSGFQKRVSCADVKIFHILRSSILSLVDNKFNLKWCYYSFFYSIAEFQIMGRDDSHSYN